MHISDFSRNYTPVNTSKKKKNEQTKGLARSSQQIEKVENKRGDQERYEENWWVDGKW